MWKQFGLSVGLVFTAAAILAHQDPAPPAPAEPAKIPDDAVKAPNPVKPTPAGLAHAKKLFGFDCAMCHGKAGDGQGDLALDMKLNLPDWRDPATLKDVTDGEMYYIIGKGKGKMPAGADQMKPDEIWMMVNYVRTFADKTAAKAKP
ncbi:MAG: cytochrome c [Candidatus Acidiferrum sp.]